jgi:hypothetical protein
LGSSSVRLTTGFVASSWNTRSRSLTRIRVDNDWRKEGIKQAWLHDATSRVQTLAVVYCMTSSNHGMFGPHQINCRLQGANQGRGLIPAGLSSKSSAKSPSFCMGRVQYTTRKGLLLIESRGGDGETIFPYGYPRRSTAAMHGRYSHVSRLWRHQLGLDNRSGLLLLQYGRRIVYIRSCRGDWIGCLVNGAYSKGPQTKSW